MPATSLLIAESNDLDDERHSESNVRRWWQAVKLTQLLWIRILHVVKSIVLIINRDSFWDFDCVRVKKKIDTKNQIEFSQFRLRRRRYYYTSRNILSFKSSVFVVILHDIQYTTKSFARRVSDDRYKRWKSRFDEQNASKTYDFHKSKNYDINKSNEQSRHLLFLN